MPSIVETLNIIKDEFSVFSDPRDKYVFLVDLAKDLEGLDDQEKNEINRIHGCTSQAWVTRKINGEKYFRKLEEYTTINYLKQHQPIGCRDKYTQTILEKHKIKTFLSCCVTLTLKKTYFINSSYKENRALIIGAFDRLKPNIQTNMGLYKMTVSTIKAPYKLLNYQIKKLIFKRWLKKQKIKFNFANQIVQKKISSHSEGIKLAENLLEKIANSDYVITSRIHSALPAVAMGKKVVFINEGLDNINHRSRLVGLESFFTTIKLKEIRMLNFDSIKIDMNHKEYSNKITKIINTFLNR